MLRVCLQQAPEHGPRPPSPHRCRVHCWPVLVHPPPALAHPHCSPIWIWGVPGVYPAMPPPCPALLWHLPRCQRARLACSLLAVGRLRRALSLLGLPLPPPPLEECCAIGKGHTGGGPHRQGATEVLSMGWIGHPTQSWHKKEGQCCTMWAGRKQEEGHTEKGGHRGAQRN